MKKLVLALLIATLPLLVAATPVFANCGDTKTQIVSCDSKTGTGSINALISIVISVMTIGIGIVAVGGFAYAGIIYASAHDDQSKVSEAKTIARNIVIGILLYGFTIAIIGWLLPGSVIGGADTSSSPSPSASASPSTSTKPTTK